MFLTKAIIVEDDPIFLEDNIDKVKNLYEFDKIETYSSLEEFENATIVTNNNNESDSYESVCIFDINLNPISKSNRDGFKCNQLMRNASPESLIYNYSGYLGLEKRALVSGANNFFPKEAYSEDKYFEEKMKPEIHNYFKEFREIEQFKELGFNTKYNIYAMIESVIEERQLVSLKCVNDDTYFYKQYPLERFNHIGLEALCVDLPLNILIMEHPESGDRVHKIRKSNKNLQQEFSTKDEFFPEILPQPAKKLVNSPIFKMKNKDKTKKQ